MKLQAGAEVLGDIGEDATKERGGVQSGKYVLHGGGTCGALILNQILGSCRQQWRKWWKGHTPGF